MVLTPDSSQVVPAPSLGKVLSPLPVLLKRIKLEPGEVLLIAVHPNTAAVAMTEIYQMAQAIFGKDSERVLVYEQGQLEFTTLAGDKLVRK